MGTKSRSDVTSINKQLVAALQEYYAKKSLVVDGTTLPATSIIADLQKEDALVASTAKARSAWAAQVVALRAQTAANNKLRKALHASVLVNFAKDVTALGAFGYAVPQASKPSSQTKATAAQKSRATRAARHIMGSKQRKALQAAPVTPAAEPSATATPAPAAK